MFTKKNHCLTVNKNICFTCISTAATALTVEIPSTIFRYVSLQSYVTITQDYQRNYGKNITKNWLYVNKTNNMDLMPNLTMKAIHLFLLLSICILYEIPSIDTTISPSSKGKKAKQPKELKVNAGPVTDNVFDRGLVDDEPLASDILLENSAYYRNTDIRNFNGTVLGYVTPVSYFISICNDYIWLCNKKMFFFVNLF